MSKHTIKYEDVKNLIFENIICSAVGQNENKRLIMITKLENRTVFFKVINYNNQLHFQGY